MDHPIRTARRAKEFTQGQVGELTGISTGAISKIENRKITPLVGTLKKLASCLDVDWRELVED